MYLGWEFVPLNGERRTEKKGSNVTLFLLRSQFVARSWCFCRLERNLGSNSAFEGAKILEQRPLFGYFWPYRPTANREIEQRRYRFHSTGTP